ncbi:amino acid ABC transporter permease [Endozoicomonas sp.]|uniref:amino acid ABC transporter permease n=1 Tax=Endozoicomonas sp. TaxID=1892382 RepID=UPI00383B3185
MQGVVVLVIVMLGVWVINNTMNNLEHRGISTGFDFLSQEAGFGILQSLVEYDESHSYGRTFVVGILNTLLVSGLGIFFATVLGFFVGVARLSSNWLLARLASVFVETFRNIPLLLQILFWYFAVLAALPHPRQSYSMGDAVFLNLRGLFLPRPIIEQGLLPVMVSSLMAVGLALLFRHKNRQRRIETGKPFSGARLWMVALLLGIPALAWSLSGASLVFDTPALKGFNFRGGISIIPELGALLLALTIYTAAFIAEVVRAGIESVQKGQKEAAASLGLQPGKVLKLVVIPQAMKVIIPPLTNQYLNLAKNSSLATAIGYPDLVSVFAGTTLNQTGQAVEVIAMTMAVYLTISLSVSLLMNTYNQRVALIER